MHSLISSLLQKHLENLTLLYFIFITIFGCAICSIVITTMLRDKINYRRGRQNSDIIYVGAGGGEGVRG